MIKILPDYITQKEEEFILSKFPKHPKNKGTERNSIVRYGSSLPYVAKVKTKIPDYFATILSRLKEDNIIDSDSITVNEYYPGQSIGWHVDSLSSGPSIIVLSLKSEAIMSLRKVSNYSETYDVTLPPRSLLILDGEERYDWEHSIYPLQQHRYSVIFRKGTNVNI